MKWNKQFWILSFRDLISSTGWFNQTALQSLRSVSFFSINIYLTVGSPTSYHSMFLREYLNKLHQPIHTHTNFGSTIFSWQLTHEGNSVIMFYPGGNQLLPPIPGCIKYIFEDCYGCLIIFPSCFLSQTSTFFGQPYGCTTCVLLAVPVGCANLYVAVLSCVQLCLCQPVMLLPKTSQLLYPHSWATQ